MDNSTFWRMPQKEGETYNIEWSYKGIVRARLDSLAQWEYKVCKEAKYAEGIGNGIIEEQKKIRG